MIALKHLDEWGDPPSLDDPLSVVLPPSNAPDGRSSLSLEVRCSASHQANKGGNGPRVGDSLLSILVVDCQVVQRPCSITLHFGGARREELGDEGDGAEAFDLLLVVLINSERLKRPSSLGLDMPVLVAEEHHQRLDAPRRSHRLLVASVDAEVLEGPRSAQLCLPHLAVEHGNEGLDRPRLRDRKLVLLVGGEVPQRARRRRLHHGVAGLKELDKRVNGSVLRHQHLALRVKSHRLQLHRCIGFLVRVALVNLSHEL
mmetsp:Transcript_20016/g.46106  ORF Transcript_20016/g.46106 Transcript_20016/m.46106 type:complete len:258 (-) Transcript_20016:92-865(-)